MGEPSSLVAAATAAASPHSSPSSLIVKYLHAIPRFNLTFQRVSNHFNPNNSAYTESLGIMALIPASILIVYLVGVLMYLLTRCCDRKSRRDQSHGCAKCTLIFFSILCAVAVGAGLYGNDELHKGISDVFGSGRQVERLVKNVKNQTESLKYNLKTKVTVVELEDTFDKPIHDQTRARNILDTVRWVKDNTTLAINALEAVSYLIKNSHSEQTIRRLFDNLEFYEAIRMPTTLGFLVLILVMCIMLVIGLIRSSRCTLILFSVVGLLCVTICWIVSSGYLVSAVALGDFCTRPHDFICNQQKVPDIHYTNCGTLGTNTYILRLNESRDHIDKAKDALYTLSALSRENYPRDIGPKISRFDGELKNTKKQLADLASLLDRRTVEYHYRTATKSLCGPSLLGLTLMLVAGLVMALMLSILVCVDSHVWIYLGTKRPKGDKLETMPLFPSGPAPIIGGANTAGTATTGLSTTNRTLLHHQQQNQFGSNGNGLSTGTIGRNGSTLRGLAYSGDSPPPEYNVVVHDKRQPASSSSGHQTLGRLPSQHQNTYGSGPGKYATLSKQCKTLQSNDFY